jgi:CRP/FNR family cyclic AMP-dependent transcriptional regulator
MVPNVSAETQASERPTSESIHREHYKQGDYIFFEGDIENHFYIIEKGEVQIFTKANTGKRINICSISAGESFGEFALLDNSPRSASAEAMSDVSLIKVSAEGYEHLLAELPVWASCMLKSFMTRLKNMNTLLKASDQFINLKK